MMKWFKRRTKETTSSAVPDQVEESGVEAEPALAEAIEADPESAPDHEGPLEMAPELDDVGEAAFHEAPEDTMPAEGDADKPESRRFFRTLRERLHRTREQLAQRVDRLVLGKKQIDLDLLNNLEEILITSDLGVQTTQHLLERVADRVKRKELADPDRLRDELRQEIQNLLAIPAPSLDLRRDKPFVVMVVGVNGVGKTTTIGKLAHQWKNEGLEVMLVAGDTFRAAAVEQLTLWGERVGVPVIRQKSGSDPSAVAFDAIDAALARGADVVLLDTAGRMHTKVNLMEEVKKVQRVIGKKLPAAPHEVLLVLDATTGQNALSQARLFKSELGITGLILTKLDGTAKGGIVAAICQELQVPVRFIGIGEGLEDLQPFDPEQFARALF
jgi:fused signal recognition particle receptor